MKSIALPQTTDRARRVKDCSFLFAFIHPAQITDDFY
jgi:hypothetical protein